MDRQQAGCKPEQTTNSSKEGIYYTILPLKYITNLLSILKKRQKKIISLLRKKKLQKNCRKLQTKGQKRAKKGFLLRLYCLYACWGVLPARRSSIIFATSAWITRNYRMMYIYTHFIK